MRKLNILICFLTQYFKDAIDNLCSKLLKKTFPTKCFVFILSEILLFTIEYLSKTNFNGEMIFITSIKALFISAFAVISVEKMMKKKSELNRDLNSNEVVEIVSEDLLSNNMVNGLVSDGNISNKVK